jgi:hypothetical protein
MAHPGRAAFLSLIFICLALGASGAFCEDMGADHTITGSAGLFISRPEGFTNGVSLSPLQAYGDLSFQTDFYNGIGFDVALEHDAVTLNRVIARAGYEGEFFSLKIGGFIGAFNTEEKRVSPGMSIEATAALPGEVFGSLRFDTVAGTSRLRESGSFSQEYFAFTAGFWVGVGIITANLSTRAFVKNESDIETENRRRQYFIQGEFFRKTWPLRLRARLGFEEFTWAYEDDDFLLTAFYAGLGMTFRFGGSVSLFFDGDAPLFSWDGGAGAFARFPYFTASLGLSVTFSR